MKSTEPKLLKASIVSALVGAALPVVALAFAYYEYNYGAPIEASEAQGGFIIIVHCIAALLFCVLVYPTIGLVLHSRNSLSSSKFRLFTYLSLVVFSVIPAIFLVFVGFGPPALIISIVSFLILAVLCLPVGALWFKLAMSA